MDSHIVKGLKLLTFVYFLVAGSQIGAMEPCESLISPTHKTEILFQESRYLRRFPEAQGEVQKHLSTVLKHLKEWKLPAQLLVSVVEAESGFQAKTRLANHQEDEIAVSSEPGIILHELGHVIFEHNLMLADIPFSRDLREYRHQRQLLTGPVKPFLDEYELAMKRFGFHYDVTTHPHHHRVAQYRKNLQELSKKYPNISAVGMYYPMLYLYSELFADSFAFAMTGDSRIITDLVSKYQKYSSKGKSYIDTSLRARNFDKVVTVEFWENKFPYNDPHNYFGPANSVIGQKIRHVKVAERIKLLEQLYQILIDDIEKVTQLDENGKFVFSEDIAINNQRLIDQIKERMPDPSVLDRILSVFAPLRW